MPSGPPSSARHRARCNSAALAEEYALAFFPAAMAFFEATKMRLPPTPCSFMILNASRATRKYPFARTVGFVSHIYTRVFAMRGGEEGRVVEDAMYTPPKCRILGRDAVYI